VPTKTLGWKPSCKCKEFICQQCGFVLDSKRGKITITKEGLSNMPEGVQGRQKTTDILQPPLLSERSAETDTDQLPTVREPISTSESSISVLQQEMFNEMGSYSPTEFQRREDFKQPGLRLDLDAEKTRNSQIRIHLGTSLSDGAETKACSPTERSRSSPEWQSDGQQTRKPRGASEADTRSETQADISSYLPELQPRVYYPESCPRCGGRIVARTPKTVSAKVLDCFSGSGTTPLVADKLGWIGNGSTAGWPRTGSTKMRRCWRNKEKIHG